MTVDLDDPDADAFHEEAAPLPPIDVDAALDLIRTADETTCASLIASLPDALAADRLDADGAARIEHAIETRRDYLEQEVTA